MIQIVGGLPGSLDVLPGISGFKWEFAGFTGLAGNGANITVTLKRPYRYLLALARIAGYTGNNIARWQFNGDTGANYGAVASEPSDAAATSTINTNGILVGETAQTAARALQVMFAAKDAAGRIARVRGMGIDDTEVITTAVALTSHGGIWNNTTALFTSVTLNEGATGGNNLLTGSNVVVFGADTITA